MRTVGYKEKRKYGCNDCMYQAHEKVYVKTERSNYYKYTNTCIFDKCPFREIKKHESYDDYLKSNIGNAKLRDL